MPKSPCINICRMDTANRYCVGCLRTLDEIAAWSRLDASAQADILRAVTERRALQPPASPAQS